MKDTDQHILSGSPIETVFNGKTYTWKQRPRAEQREIRSELSKVIGFLSGGENLTEADTVTFSLDAINAIIVFCENHNADMNDDMDDIEAHLMTSGAQSWAVLINDVFMPVYKAWLEPWLVGNESAGKKPKKPARRKSTK